MKHIALVAVAVISLFLAFPLSHASAKQHLVSDSHLVSNKVVNSSIPVDNKKTSHSVQAPETHTAEQSTTNTGGATTTTSKSPAITDLSNPSPTVTLTPVVEASGECTQYASIFEQYSWNAQIAMAICQAESGGNPNPPSNAAINYDGVSDYGLMQLHGIDITDPAANIAYAYYHKYLTQGWGAWSTYSSGEYLKFL